MSAALAQDLALPAAWKARPGDDPASASADLDDRAWAAGPAMSWRRVPELARAPIVWYRAEIEVPTTDDLALVVRTPLAAHEVFVDGVRVGESRSVASRPRVYRLAHGPGPARVALRIRSPGWASAYGSGPALVALGDRWTVELLADQTRLAARQSVLVQLVDAVAWLVFGGAHLALWLRRRSLAGHRWFGLGALALGAHFLLEALIAAGDIPPVPYAQRWFYLLNGAGWACLLRATAELFRTGRSAAEVAGAVIFGAAVVRMLLFVRFPQIELPLLVLAVTVGGGVALRNAVLGLQRDVPGARWVGVGVLGFLAWPLALVIDAAVGLGAWLPTIRAVCSLWLTMGFVLALAQQFVDSLDDVEATLAAARWFVPAEVLERLGRARLRDVRRGDAARLEQTMLFFDLRGFSTVAEEHTPEDTFAFLNALFDLVEPAVRANGGVVVQFTGDGFLALYESPEGAVRSAVEQLEALASFRPELLDGRPVAAGIGIHTGPIVLGTLGGREQLLAGVVADAANVASRIESMTRFYGVRVLVSETTRTRVGPAFTLREVDRVVAKGRRGPIAVFELLDVEPSQVRAERMSGHFAAGYAAYGAGRFDEAIAAFMACAGDPVAAALAERARALAATPPEAWDGVWRFATK